MPVIKPSWLPSTIQVNPNSIKVIGILYKIFKKDFVQTGCKLKGNPVWWDRTKAKGNKCVTFWHLITILDETTGSRVLDQPRAERLPWCKPLIENYQDVEIKAWEYRESGGIIRTYIWLENWDYVVILEKTRMDFGEVYRLITAFHLTYNSNRRSLLSKYKKRVRPTI